jgi:hypothetical protein
MADSTYTLDARSMRLLIEDHRLLRSQVQNLQRQLARKVNDSSLGHVLKHGITTTNTANPAYPTSPANTFVVQLQSWDFTETPGNQSRTTKSGKYVIAHDPYDLYWPQGSRVSLRKTGRHWFIQHDQFLLGKPDSAIAKNASGTVSVYGGTPGSETDTTYNITAWNKFVPSIASGKWVAMMPINLAWYIIAAEC